MAILAIGQGMRTHQWKAVVLVQFCDVVHQPVVGIVAPGAVVPHRLVVHVCVAGIAFHAGASKHKGCVALPAIGGGVLAGEGKIGGVVVEPRGIYRHFPACYPRFSGLSQFVEFPVASGNIPAIRRVAGGAIDLKFGAVRRLGLQADHPPQQQNQRWQSTHRKLLNLY